MTHESTFPVSITADAVLHVPHGSRILRHGIVQLPLATDTTCDPEHPDQSANNLQLKCWVCVELYDPVTDTHYDLSGPDGLDTLANNYGTYLDLEGRTAATYENQIANQIAVTPESNPDTQG